MSYPGATGGREVVRRNSENRVADRRKRRLMVRYGVGKADRTGFTRNLSLTGLYVQTNNVLRPGTTVQVEIVFPERQFSMWAKVVWAKKVPPQLAHILECGMGVCFIDPPPEWAEFFDSWSRA